MNLSRRLGIVGIRLRWLLLSFDQELLIEGVLFLLGCVGGEAESVASERVATRVPSRDRLERLLRPVVVPAVLAGLLKLVVYHLEAANLLLISRIRRQPAVHGRLPNRSL